MVDTAPIQDTTPFVADYRVQAQALLSAGSDTPAYSIGRLLGAIREGIAMSTVTRVGKRYALSDALFASLLGVSASTIKRRRSQQGRLARDESDRFVRLAGLYAMAEDVMGSPAQASEWMARANRSLGGESPNDYAVTDTGAREVEDLLGRIAHGIAA